MDNLSRPSMPCFNCLSYGRFDLRSSAIRMRYASTPCWLTSMGTAATSNNPRISIALSSDTLTGAQDAPAWG